MKKLFIKINILLVLSVTLSSCSKIRAYKAKITEQNILLNIDSQDLLTANDVKLNIYFLNKKPAINISNKKVSRSTKNNFTINKYLINPESSIAQHSFFMITQMNLTESIKIDNRAKFILISLQTNSKILSVKLINFNYNKQNILNIKLNHDHIIINE